jgi:DNA-binding cell septation regulator SpoVG
VRGIHSHSLPLRGLSSNGGSAMIRLLCPTFNHPTANTTRAESAVRIDASKPYTKNTLRAFVDFTLIELGISIKGATIHEKNGERWVSMPSRSYSDAEGTHWAAVIEFTSQEARDRMKRAVLAAFDRFSERSRGSIG